MGVADGLAAGGHGMAPLILLFACRAFDGDFTHREIDISQPIIIQHPPAAPAWVARILQPQPHLRREVDGSRAFVRCMVSQ